MARSKVTIQFKDSDGCKVVTELACMTGVEMHIRLADGRIQIGGEDFFSLFETDFVSGE